jgi:CheY-like chemotaxis protein
VLLKDDPDASRSGRPYLSKVSVGAARASIGAGRVSNVRNGKRCILCVDDEVVATRTRAEMLRESGYTVVVYHSPLASLDCDLSMIDLAILDFHMPEMNGRELLLFLRALGARFPIVLLTGALESLSREDRVLFARCIDKGKPIRNLLDTIAEFLSEYPDPSDGS